MTRFRVPAVVLGGAVITDLGAIRSLGRAGIPVYYLNDKKNEATYSKYCRNHFTFPNIHLNKDELGRALLKLKKVIGNAVLFPTSDSHALQLSGLASELDGYYLPAPKKEIIETLINKRKFYESLMKHEMPHPTTRFPEDREDLKKMSKDMHYPVFVKPYFSQQFSERFQRKGFEANSEGDLHRYFVLMKRIGVDVMIQETTPGPPTNHVFLDGYVDRNSDPKALFARQRLRMWPLAFGNSTLCASIPSSKVTPLKNRLFRYLKSIHYHGIFSAEFKKDHRTGSSKLLEINSRTSAWFNTLSAECGINIMLIAYLDATGRNVQYSEDYTTGSKWVYLTDDLRAAARMMLNGDLKVGEYISSLLGATDYVSYAKDDLKPFLMSLKQRALAQSPRTLVFQLQRKPPRAG
jgi:predicted ATP-grasp superfamily ATP-dependent carboligase